jgi:HlyD family secretion protein
MTANVSIVIAHKDDVVKIPNGGLRYRPADATPEPRRSPAPGSAGSGRSGGSGRPGIGPRRDQKSERTVYVLRSNKPEPVTIKTGISDGVTTEVLEGLNDGDKVVTAQVSSANPTSSPPANPFAGGGRRF